MRESEFQAKVIRYIHERFPMAIVMKNDARYLQGVPDFTVLYGPVWIFLEFKKSHDATYRPNQEYYLDLATRWSYGFTLYPENWDEVRPELNAIMRTAENYENFSPRHLQPIR